MTDDDYDGYAELAEAVRAFPIVMASGNEALAKALLVVMRYAMQALEAEINSHDECPES